MCLITNAVWHLAPFLWNQINGIYIIQFLTNLFIIYLYRSLFKVSFWTKYIRFSDADKSKQWSSSNVFLAGIPHMDWCHLKFKNVCLFIYPFILFQNPISTRTRCFLQSSSLFLGFLELFTSNSKPQSQFAKCFVNDKKFFWW